MSKSSEYKLAPLRSLDEFLLESARFQIPNFKDMEKWGNRVSSNLLYFQTNYGLLSLIIFVIVGVIHPTKMACGVLVTAVLFKIFTCVISERFATAQFKKNHPIISILLVLGGAYFVAYMFESLLVFLIGILLPFAVIFIHASLRLRNIKNKILNRIEGLTRERTPMGLFLAELGVESDTF